MKQYCLAATRTGSRCKKTVRMKGELCYLHKDCIPTAPQKTCQGRIKSGQPCKRPVRGSETKCHWHILQQNDISEFKRTSLQRGSQESKRESNIRRIKKTSVKRRMSLINSLRKKSRSSEITEQLNSQNIGPRNNPSSEERLRCQKQDYLPENIFHRNEYLHCGICLDDEKKHGIRLSCCKLKQNICLECTRDMLTENYKKNMNPELDDSNKYDKKFLLKIGCTLCKCPFCRKKRSFKKFIKLLKRQIKNYKN